MIITVAQLEVFLLVLARIAGIFIQAPILSARSIPTSFKTGLAIWMALTLCFVIPVPKTLPVTSLEFILALINEVLIGFLIGFVCNLIFAAVQAAGDIMDLQMGLSVAQYLAPETGAVATLVGRLFFYTALMTFLIVDGHHLILSTLAQSFRALPIAGMAHLSNGRLMAQLIDLIIKFWTIAIQLAAPAVLLIFLSDFAFGLVSRAAPQVNVFMLGFQVKPALGLYAILMSLPLLVRHVVNLVGVMAEEALKLYVTLGPR